MVTLGGLRPLIRAAWNVDTCDPHDLANWRPENPARGQCGVTALVLGEFLGGELLLGEVFAHRERVGCHYWNRLPDGTEVDLTREQFFPAERLTAGKVVSWPDGPIRRCRGQHALLRQRVLSQLRGGESRGQPAERVVLVRLADPSGAVLLRQRPADARFEPGQWSLPGGFIEPDDDPEIAARRLLLAKTGASFAGPLLRHTSGAGVDVFVGGCDEGAVDGLVPVAELAKLDLGPFTAAALHQVIVEAHHRASLADLVRSNAWLTRVLATVREAAIPAAWVGAGVLRDLVWGERFGAGFSPDQVRDVDVVYFDPHDLSRANDDRVTQALHERWPAVPWEARNQAAVHTWYAAKFGGGPVAPLSSIPDAVGTWPETATAVAVRLDADDRLEICAPLGLTDLLDGVWRRNPRRVTVEQSRARLARHQPERRHPGVRVIPPG